MLVALYLAAEYDGSISAVLIGTPGTAAATATVMDGYPLNLKGQPGKAMGASLVGPTVGGIIGAYSIRNLMFDVWLAVGFGIVGYFLKKYRFPMAPLVLGMVLGYMVESNYRRALIMSQGNHAIFFEEPISLFFLLLAVLSFFWPLAQAWRKRRQAAAS